MTMTWTRHDLLRCLRALDPEEWGGFNTSASWCPTTSNQLMEYIGDYTQWLPDQCLQQLVVNTLGRMGPLGDALDVIEERGTDELTRRLQLIMVFGEAVARVERLRQTSQWDGHTTWDLDVAWAYISQDPIDAILPFSMSSSLNCEEHDGYPKILLPPGVGLDPRCSPILVKFCTGIVLAMHQHDNALVPTHTRDIHGRPIAGRWLYS